MNLQKFLKYVVQPPDSKIETRVLRGAASFHFALSKKVVILLELSLRRYEYNARLAR
jgi:hypothetical protein